MRYAVMEKLPSRFKYDGFEFKLIKRTERIALLRKKLPGSEAEHFEVVIIQVYPEEERFGRKYPKREKMPSTNSWGTYGWTCMTRDDAEKRFRGLSLLHDNADS